MPLPENPESERPAPEPYLEPDTEPEFQTPNRNPAPDATPTTPHIPAARVLERIPAVLDHLQQNVARAVIGQERAVEALFHALVTRGHVLLVGVPGLAKTLLVRAFAAALDLKFSRIQFTPDLMPADVTGTVVLHEDHATGKRAFRFNPGPIFGQIVLADEINRTPPKTQAALLEAMQEKTVTVAGKTRPLQEPFLVLATQNPIEQEGTYPLPEAQLDRFLYQLELDYPDLEHEREIVRNHSYDPLAGIQPTIRRDDVLLMRAALAKVPAAPEVVDYAVRLVRATRPSDPSCPETLRPLVRWGASPRAAQNLVLAARAHAVCAGNLHASRRDVAAVAPWILQHRVIRAFQADARGISNAEILRILLDAVPLDPE